jgi:iron-sulfur cluster assembly protein
MEKTMAITLTESAAKHILKQIAKSDDSIGLRLGVKQSGCSGLRYTFGMANEVLPTETVFESFGAKVLVDTASLPYLEGTELAYVQEGLNSFFKFNNPKAKNECGCGESFAV